MIELKSTTGLIVTRNETERVQSEAGVVEIIPLWRFLLYFTEAAPEVDPEK